MSRGVKHSLALSAVSALLVTGLGAFGSPASAADEPVLLVSQADGQASSAYDGSDEAIRVTAERADRTAVVTFEYNSEAEADDLSDGWTSTGFSETVERGSYVYADWTPDGIEAGTSVALRAVSTVGGVTSYSTRNDVVVNGANGDTPVASVALGEHDPYISFDPETGDPSRDQDGIGGGSPDVGYFAQPYRDSEATSTLARVAGTTSTYQGGVALSWRDAAGSYRGQVTADVQSVISKVGGSGNAREAGAFAATLDLTGFDAEAGVVALRAVNGSDVVQPAPVYAQTPTSVTVESRDDSDAITIRVADQEGRPVVGAEVRRLPDGAAIGYTDRDGNVSTIRTGELSERYYANTTDVDAYETDTDPVSTRVSGELADPSVTAVSSDGEVFDRDEYAAGDVYLQVTDQEGSTLVDPTTVYYRVQRAGDTEAGEYQSGETDARGRVEVPLDLTGADGDYVLDYQLDEPETEGPDPSSSSSPSPSPELADPGVRSGQLDFTIGEAVLSLTPDAEPDSAAAGGQLDYTGRLAIGDDVLPGRTIDLGYTRTGAGDAGILTTDGLATRLATSTGANGTFTVVIDDPASSTAAETGRLTAETGLTEATEQSTVTGDAGASTSATTSFTASAAPTPTPTPTPTPQPGRRDVTINLRANDNGPADDRLVVRGPRYAAGETIAVRRIRADGTVTVLTKVTLGREGDVVVTVPDTNGRGFSRYAVRLVRSPRVERTGAGPVRVR